MQAPPRRILELGAGDGTLLLRFAKAMQPQWTGVELTLLDRQDLISASVREAYRRLDWRINVICTDALEWARSAAAQRYDLCVTTLFLHHFENDQLRTLLAGVAGHTDQFVACEPHRSRLAKIGSRFIGFLGANAVTREDGIKSVDAGFTGSDLTEVWSLLGGDWWIDEYQAWPFTHCFLATRMGRGGAMANNVR